MNKTKLSAVRRKASKKAVEAHWGKVRRSPSRQIRVDESAYIALLEVPERDRRDVASRGVTSAAAAFRDRRRA